MKAISTILLVIFATTSFAQTETSSVTVEADSIGIENSIITDTIISGDMFVVPTLSSPRLPVRISPDKHFNAPYERATLQIPSLSFVPEQSDLYNWRNGSIIATGAQMDMPGLMHIDNGAIGISQNYKNINLYLGVEANKYGFYQGLHTQFGITGDLSYSLSPHLSVTAFGTYYFGAPPVMNGGLPMSPGMSGYYQRSTFGGYFNYRINEKYGVLVGGQAVQQTGTQNYKFEPIVTPYYKIGKVVIGLPVGQILNGIIREQVEKRRYQRHNPVQPPKR